MKKNTIIKILVVIMLCTTAITYVEAEDQTQLNNILLTEEIELTFSEPKTLEKDGFINIKIEETIQSQSGDRVPILPVKKICLEYPYGTKIFDVSFEQSKIKTMQIQNKIKPTSKQIPYGKQNRKIQSNFNEKIYESNEYFPQKMNNYNIKVGRNENNEKTTYLLIDIYPVQYSPQNNLIKYINNGNIKITYQKPEIIPSFTGEDLLIITAPAYKDELQKLKNHKENHGITTKLVTTDEINTNGRDLAEKIKKYIYQEDIPYVLLVGGFRTFFGLNKPEYQLPLRWIWIEESEPGYISELYFADTTYYDENTHTYKFDDWDSNGNGRYGEDSWTGWDDIDMMPDVSLGRLACRNINEAKTIINKIINYENTDNTNQAWFKKIMTFTGDDFQDVTDWDISWDTEDITTGEYIIHAQTTNCDGLKGNEHTVTVNVDHSKTSQVSFSEEDIDITNAEYPYDEPIAYITVPSEGDVLGRTDVEVESPPGAYSGETWTSIEYKDGIIGIKGKAYDPRIQGGENPDRPNVTLKVWITKNVNKINEWTVNSSCWFEGEHQAQLAMDYFPNDFEKIKMWTSNGGIYGLERPTVLEPEESPKIDGTESGRIAMEEGCGFFYACGHASPITWGNHYPGIPSGRAQSDVAVFKVLRFPKSLEDLLDLFPINKINNGEKLPIAVISGCHPTSLDCSLTKAIYDFQEVFHEDFGKFGPECLGWWFTRLKNGGSIATMGPAGLGTGTHGEHWREGSGTQFWSEGFFRIYNEENLDILGDVFKETQIFFLNKFTPLSLNKKKTLTEMVLIGDPTLKIGGYPTSNTFYKSQPKNIENIEETLTKTCPEKIELKSIDRFIDKSNKNTNTFAGNDFQVTTNPLNDKKPEAFSTNGNGAFIVGFEKEVNTHSGNIVHDGFAVSNGGVVWKELIKANGDDEITHQGLGYAGIGRKAVGTRYNGVGSNFDIILMDDMTDEYSWEVRTYYSTSGDIYDRGKNGCDICGDYYNDELHWISCATISTTEWNNGMNQVAMFSTSKSDYSQIFIVNGNYIAEQVSNVDVEIDRESHRGIFAIENPDGIFIGRVETGGQYGIDTIIDIPYIEGNNPDVAVNNGKAIVLYEKAGLLKYRFSDNIGLGWSGEYNIPIQGEKPEVTINDYGWFDCYYVRNGEIYKAVSVEGPGLLPMQWTEQGKVSGISNYDSNDIFAAVQDALIYPKTDGDLYVHIDISTTGIDISDILVFDNNKIKTTIQNAGTSQITSSWTIEIEGTNPLSHLGIPDIVKGRVFNGEETTGNLNLDSGESIIIESDPIKGLGFCDVNVEVEDYSKTEDGFMILDQLIIYHPKD